MNNFKRENRYWILKLKEIKKVLSKEELIILYNLMVKLDHARFDEGKKQLKAVVIESDWDCYEEARALVERETNK